MSPLVSKLLITGATGYIGGDVLHAILLEFPNLEPLTCCFVRKSKRSESLRAAYPSLRLIYGDFDDLELLESLASQVDIVVHCASIENVSASNAIAQGLAKRDSPGPAFWICASGTDILAWETIHHDSYGETYHRIYDDTDRIADILELPDDAPHKDVEAAQRAASSPQVQLAIVCAPCIYGRGRGCGNQRSIQLPDLAQFTIKSGQAFKIGRGLNRWPNVHVHDLSDVFVRLVGQALEGGGNATWGSEGYYFAENGEHVWGEVAEQMAKEAQKQGLISSAYVTSLTAQEADQKLEYAALFYGTDSRCKAKRARQILGWNPRKHSIKEEIEETLVSEKALTQKARF